MKPMKRIGLIILVLICLISGCIDTNNLKESNEKEGEIINEGSIIGSWSQKETNSKLIFLSNDSFKWLSSTGYSDGTWKIENNKTLVLTMDVWDYSSNSDGEYIGPEKVSFGKISDNILSFTTINDDSEKGFPVGKFIPE